MKSNYEACLAITLKWEGGDVDHPADPGGKTRWGITQATYNAYRKAHHLSQKSVFTMTKPEMLAIYKENYWDAVKGDTLGSGVDLAVWDYGVNSGPARAKKDLLSVVGGDSVSTIKKLCAKRMSFVRGLKTWKTFGKGWSRRIADVEARAVKMAHQVSAPAKSVAPALKAEAEKAVSTAKTQANTTKTSGGVAAGGSLITGADTSAALDQYIAWGLLGLVFVGVGVAIYFHRKAKHNKERAAAFLRVAEEG